MSFHFLVQWEAIIKNFTVIGIFLKITHYHYCSESNGSKWARSGPIQTLCLEGKRTNLECIIGFIHHLSTPLRRCFFSLLSCSAARFREHIQCCMCRTAILKNDSTAEKRRKEEAFALASIAHCCFVETKTNCG